MNTGIERIAAERQRQIEVEGWTPEHDASHEIDFALALAAVCYAFPEEVRRDRRFGMQSNKEVFWPWSEAWWKPTPNNRIRELEKAGALIAAEIDRLEALQ